MLGLFGLAGAGGLGGVVTTWIKDRRDAEVGERSVAIVELEKAVPGLGEVIAQLRAQTVSQAGRIDEQDREIDRLRRRVTTLEHDLAMERGHS